MLCAAPNGSNPIPVARRKRYPNTKTCSMPCSKEYRKAYVAEWMRLYLQKKADLYGDPRWETVREYEATGRAFDAWLLRGKIKKDVAQADRERRGDGGGRA